MSEKLFDKVLIANRGEIACRVMKTCKRLGIKTVAVHSTADAYSRFVAMADEAVCIGPPPSNESYICIDKIVDACLKTKANAVHPGYGFLSERPDFSAELAKNNIIFVGPDAKSMDMVSDKIESKKLATEAKVNCIPGFQGAITSHEQLIAESNKIGYPVMVKASGGGGGKGMHIAFNDKEAVEYFEICKAEAMANFGVDTMLVEKFVLGPRHIEIQIIADRHGNTLYLPERECSIQRRNQKVIEEAPSTFINEETRRAMGEQAAAYARRVNYVSAGTVEMMVDKNRDFYFLEMNTRLQVEHPITELITGVDLVEQMLRAAADKPLSIKQEDIKINGWAHEARICAEDPVKKYFPSIGRISPYKEPEGEGIRVDSGIIAGSHISVYYDSLIAKCCAWGPTRDVCIDRLQGALDRYVIRGLNHNVCLIHDVLNQKKYRDGDITTNYLPETYPDGFKKAALTLQKTLHLQLVSAALRMVREARYMSGSHRRSREARERFGGVLQHDFGIVLDAQPGGEVQFLRLSMDLKKGAVHSGFISSTNHDHNFKFAFTSGKGGEVQHEGELKMTWEIDTEVIDCVVTSADEAVAGESVLQFHGCDEIVHKVQTCGTVFKLAVLDESEATLWQHMPIHDASASLKRVTSPMPGVVVDVHVKVGDQVVAGDELLTLEAMKMRNKIRAEIDGKIKSVNIKAGDRLDDAALMIEFE